ncbi:hypothetical protein MPH_01041 [Macrophomina phaseolina MS6]|uniref:Uncharacterized protein n=1 Tax=Macrophomina phaseolina (strain MS6) TaxID=1126212 RepID=K2S9P2_MACPH|nr:hypothetical protein MPH_01041 [Macrophomina phaseolina MS6]
MPSPLSGPFPPTIPADIPSHEQLLTHFHVLHYHIDDVVRVFRDLQKSSEEEIIGDNEKRINDMRSAMDEYFADVRSHLNAIEHNMGRATGETENLKNALETHVRSVDEHVYKPMRKLTNQNTELIKKVDSLQERVTHLEKKLENNMPIYGASENGDRNRPAGVDGPAPSFGRPWGGYDAARHMVPVHQQQQQQQQDHQYTDVGGRYYNGPDAQHHNYQDGYYANGSYNNYMR